MTVTISYPNECYSEQASHIPRTPYPYDATKDGSVSSPEGSVVSISSGEGSHDDCYYHLPEGLALSPKVVEKSESPEPDHDTGPSTPSESLRRLAESPELDGRLVEADHFDTPVHEIALEEAEAVHLTASGKCQTLVNVSNPRESGNLCFDCLTRTPSPDKSRRSPPSIDNRKLIKFPTCIFCLLTPSAARPAKRARRSDLKPLLPPPALQQHSWIPTPISPDRHFSQILAERSSSEGRMFKVVWRDSWVHESRLPDIEDMRVAHVLRHGRHWDVYPSN